MPTYRLSIRHEQRNTRSGGWSENYWLNASSQDDAKAKSLSLINAMLNFKGGQTAIPRYRIGQYGVFRGARSYANGTTTAMGGPSADSDYPTTKIQLRFTGTAPAFTTQWMGGILDSCTGGGGFWQPTAAALRGFNAIVSVLTNVANGFGIYALNPANPRLVVTAVNGTTGQVTTATTHAFNNNDYVRIQRVNGIDGINGVWQIKVVDTFNFTMIGWQSTTQIMTRSNARVQLQSRLLQPITAVDVVQVTKHDVGRPTDQLGGRRKRPSSSLVGPLVAR